MSEQRASAGKIFTGSSTTPATAAKRDLRRTLLDARGARPAPDRAAAGAAIADVVLAAAEFADAPPRTVAAYVSVGGEPPTGPLLERLLAGGCTVLLPVLLPGGDLDWARYAGPDALAPAGRRLREPVGPRLGPSAVQEADVVLVPALAVDRRGLRLGRGGGSFDRVLARLDPSTWTCALLYAGEVLETVPSEPHDRAVAAAATPSALVRFR